MSSKKADMNKPILTIIRGLPGSGKTIAALFLARHKGVMVIEPDALLVEGFEYHYTPERYYLAKRFSLEMVTICGIMGCDVVYADVLPTIADVEQVINAYCLAWAKPQIKVVEQQLMTVEESLARNCHHVRREDIERMAREWQPWEGQ